MYEGIRQWPVQFTPHQLLAKMHWNGKWVSAPVSEPTGGALISIIMVQTQRCEKIFAADHSSPVHTVAIACDAGEAVPSTRKRRIDTLPFKHGSGAESGV